MKRTTFTALDEVSLDIGDEEFVTVVGPSGCGKSTLLNLAAGRPSPRRAGRDRRPRPRRA
ncbi:ATP-binding cassette domain-containing protein [Streptomyces sp. gb1(2016)]|uniref:ATP-binding cassette domain-containing protein n=1 Tax=Streptomyces sp. gb1(2016) TaxID=1828321 RepID=UPI0039678B73